MSKKNEIRSTINKCNRILELEFCCINTYCEFNAAIAMYTFWVDKSHGNSENCRMYLGKAPTAREAEELATVIGRTHCYA